MSHGTFTIRAEGDRLVFHHITGEDGQDRTLPGSWAQMTFTRPEAVELRLARPLDPPTELDPPKEAHPWPP